ncbi:MAG: hypothetical protein LBK53_02135 [Heliobacteriaceae bacterium]|jgi:hypothetical protein|nr:hypothetical protein [Heliobacteriaceae bacterium]
MNELWKKIKSIALKFESSWMIILVVVGYFTLIALFQHVTKGVTDILNCFANFCLVLIAAYAVNEWKRKQK